MSSKNKRLLAPSILSADFSKLGEEIREVEKAGADWIHVDVMDGHFVPNLTIGPAVVRSIRPITKLKLDCHLMVTHPEKWIEPFAKAGADLITIHIEVAQKPKEIFKKIRNLGCEVGVSLSPDTPVDALGEILGDVDLVLVMSVHPGFGGQAFIEESYDKIRALKNLQKSKKFLIEVDGGVTESNVSKLSEAGTEVFVAGSSIFSKGDAAAATRRMKGLL